MAGGSRVRLATRRGQDAPSEAYVGVTAAIEGYAIHPIWFVPVPKLSRSRAAARARGRPPTLSWSRYAPDGAGRNRGERLPAARRLALPGLPGPEPVLGVGGEQVQWVLLPRVLDSVA
jgi:hypothetical protein